MSLFLCASDCSGASQSAQERFWRRSENEAVLVQHRAIVTRASFNDRLCAVVRLWPARQVVVGELDAHNPKNARCVLDGEIVCLDSNGKSQFRDLMFRRAEPFFYAFDILWDEHAWSDDEQERHRFRNGEDVRYLPLCDRKLRLRAVVPKRSERLLYCDHIEGDGEGLFRLVCGADLEGVVAKHKYAPYLTDADATWFKIRNRSYSQWVGRAELFEREREVSPDLHGWDACAIACAAAESLGVAQR